MSEWGRTVKTGRRDRSEPAVVEAFEAGGARVVKHSGKDEPDLFVGFAGSWHPVESKTGNEKLTEGQLRWWREVAKRRPVVARTAAQARAWLKRWDNPALSRVLRAQEVEAVKAGAWQGPEPMPEEAA